MRKRIIALLLTFVTLLGVFVTPASARARGLDDASHVVSDFWDLAARTVFPIYGIIAGFLDESKTPETATETDWQNAYTSYTTNIQNNYNTTIIDDTGAGRIPITGWRCINEEEGLSVGFSDLTIGSPIPVVRALSTGSIVSLELKATFSVSALGNYQVVFPSATSSHRLYSYKYNCYWRDSGNNYRYFDKSGSLSSASVCSATLTSGRTYEVYIRLGFDCNGNQVLTYNPSDCIYLVAQNLYPADSGLQSTDSRVGTFSGNFGYYGDGGQLTTAENISIVNETNNTYTNPATGQTSPISSWSYDYSDRSYKLNLEGGSTTTVTYGDEHVTIKEGDTVYNIYYMVPDSTTPDPTPTPSPSPSTPPTTPPATCTHNYTETVTTPPSCLSAGSKTLTCSLCQDTKTEKVPATGHAWVVDRTVNTTYDEEGNVLTQGYTIYKCSSCATEYKDTEGTGPPGDSGESSGGGFLNWLFGKLGEIFGSIGEGVLTLLQTALGKIFDGIIAIINMLTEKLSTVIDALFKVFDEVPAMFSGFTEFLTKVFAYIPPEIITIITFGILAVVLVAIFNAIRGR